MRASEVVIRVGSTYDDRGGSEHATSKTVVHEDYKYLKSYDNDVAVLVLPTSMSNYRSSSVQPAAIPPRGYVVPDNASVVAVGWGLTDENCNNSSPLGLRHVGLRKVDRDTCAARFSIFFSYNNMLCAGLLGVGGAGICSGDSGGPLVYNGVVVGVTSFSVTCDDSFYPQVFMRVSSYTNWINNTHKKIQMYTWKRQNERSIIDFVIVDERLRVNVADTRAYRGVNVGTDHFLVESRIRGLFNYWRHRPQVSTTNLERIKVKKLQDDVVSEEYRRSLKENLESTNILDENDLEEKWKCLKDNLVNTAVKLCGVNKRKKSGKRELTWWDDECKKVVNEKKMAWLDLLSKKANNRMQGNKGMEDEMKEFREKYVLLKKKVKEVIERKKKALKDECDRKFSDNFRANIKLFWKLVRKARGKSENTNLDVIRDENGDVLNDENKVLKRWKEYFESLFESTDCMTVSDVEVESERIIDEEYKISMKEIMDALKRIKVGKSAGYDRVSLEMLRGGGGVAASELYQLFNECWRCGTVPRDWCRTVIVPLYKGKVSLQTCNSYRGISLLSIVGKLYAKILIERVVKETEEKIWDVQGGFRKGMGCTDQVFSLRSVTEKVLAKQQKVFCGL
ncbi:unnamed protein product [Plutella xylostella]|uniref:(diamondback moth) hypothetical protein n=1 Tax=Plutella xylostella TaxID=51655 RepID=A0A8S4E0Q6_PLUXY|nr:unnamed protein product [Plutella xylostella]